MTKYLNPHTHSDSHPDSYYVATRHFQDTYPTLEGEVQVDVCIVGGGLSGINTAIELAERGDKVAVVEARMIGWGASGRNGGQLIRGIGHGLEQFRKQIGQEGIEAISRMGFEAVDIARQRIEKFGIECDLKMGYCDLANKARHYRDFEEEYEFLQSVNYPHRVELIPQARMPEIVGAEGYVGGLVDMGSGHLHPLNLITGEARAAASLGVQIFENSPVTRIDEGTGINESAGIQVYTEKGRIRADKLVICGNAYVAGLHKVLETKVLPAGSYIIATEPLTEEQCRKTLPQDMAVCDQNVALDYYRLSADRRLLFGGRCNYSGRDPKSIEDVMRPDLVKLFPHLRDVKIEYQWGGMIGIGANRLPQIGRLRPNVYYAQAYAGHGLNATHMAGRLIAESMHGETRRIEHFEKVKHMTFPGGAKFRSPLLAMGMLYYRFLDLF